MSDKNHPTKPEEKRKNKLMSNGYFSVYRRHLIDNESGLNLFEKKNADLLRVYLWVLNHAAFEDDTEQLMGMKANADEFITTIQAISTALNMDWKKVKRKINELKDANVMTMTCQQNAIRTPKGDLIKPVKLCIIDSVRCINSSTTTESTMPTSRQRHANVTPTRRHLYNNKEGNKEELIEFNLSHADGMRPPIDSNLNTEPEIKKEAGPKPPRVAKPKETPNGSRVFDAYAKAYFEKYGCDPPRNALANRKCKELYERLGEDAIEVVKFYLTHNDRWYVGKAHGLEWVVKDAEKILLEWRKGLQILHTDVIRHERDTQLTQVFERFKRKQEAKDAGR